MRSAFLVFLLTVFWSLTPRPSRAQAQDSDSKRAESVLAQAMQAVGAEAFLSADLVIRYEGQALWEGQGASPQNTVRLRRFERVDVIDDTNKRFARHQETFYPDGAPSSCSRFTAGPDGGVFHDCLAASVRHSPESKGMAVIGGWRQQQLAGLLTKTWQARHTLRWLEARSVGGRTLDVLSAEDEPGQLRFWYIEKGSHLPARVEWTEDDPILGQVPRHISFHDFRDLGDWRYPFHTVRNLHADQSFVERVESITVADAPSESLFAIPDNLTEWPNFGTPSPQRTTWLADGVLFLENVASTYNVLLVNTSDGLVVLDAPVNEEVGRRILDVVAEEFDGASVRFVVPTHFHWDHIGGLAAFISSGATVVTTRGNESFVRHLAESSGDSLSISQVKLVSDVMTIGDAPRRVELYAIDGTPHVDEIILPYLPDVEFLFVADLFQKEVGGHIAPARPETIAFLSAVESLGLEIDRLVPAHGELAKMADVQTAIDRLAQMNQ